MFVCPYCGKHFSREEILFYRDSYSRYPLHRIEYAPGQSRPERFELGAVTRDTVLEHWLQQFGCGVFFSCNRTTTFYGIKSRAEMMEHPVPGYGYIENSAEEGIPDRLRIWDRRPDGTMDWMYATYPICPNCHCDLPVDYFCVPEEQHHTVALVGCASAGETRFLVTALEDMMARQCDRLGLVRSFELELCSAWFHSIALKFGFGGDVMPAMPCLPRFPLLARVKTDGGEIHYITFYVYSQDEATNPDNTFDRTRLYKADTVMLLVNAVRLFGEEKRNDCFTRGLDYEETVCQLHRWLDVKETLRHFIAVITDCDVLINPGIAGEADEKCLIHKLKPETDIPSGLYISDLEEHEWVFRYRRVLENAAELKEIMSSVGLKDMETAISRGLGGIQHCTFDLLAVSTYARREPDGPLVKVEEFEDVTFHRLVEPLLVAMHNWGMLPDDGVPPHRINEKLLPEPELPPKPPSLWKRLFGKRKAD